MSAENEKEPHPKAGLLLRENDLPAALA